MQTGSAAESSLSSSSGRTGRRKIRTRSMLDMVFEGQGLVRAIMRHAFIAQSIAAATKTVATDGLAFVIDSFYASHKCARRKGEH